MFHFMPGIQQFGEKYTEKNKVLDILWYLAAYRVLLVFLSKVSLNEFKSLFPSHVRLCVCVSFVKKKLLLLLNYNNLEELFFTDCIFFKTACRLIKSKYCAFESIF